MSLNPHLGHLYHDGNISSIYTALDVQENLKTREINARETKYLDKYSQVLERAKTVCSRRNEWEQTSLRKQLKHIETKTPSLAKGLRLESERTKYLTYRNTTGSPSHLPDIRNNQNSYKVTDDKGEQRHVFVSSWSVYSNRVTRNYSAPVTSYSREDKGYRNDRFEMYGMYNWVKSPNSIKKAERVTKTLHKLYTQTLQRKLKEDQTTVLDVLGKESKEELEKALFVLRGTPAGDVIENILNEKELVSKKRLKTTSVPSDSSDFTETSPSVFITGINEKGTLFNMCDEIKKESPKKSIESIPAENGETQNCGADDKKNNSCPQLSTAHFLPERSDKISLGYIRTPSNSICNGSLTSRSFNSSKNSSLKLRHRAENHRAETTNSDEVFIRDDSWMMSSTLANASDVDSSPVTVRWTDLFKTPELWKQSNTGIKKGKPVKNISLVTLTGKRRQTMLKR